MARKVRRVRRSSGQTSARITSEEELREEYAYVIQDLRRVFILAIAMFLLLIGLNLII
jgi:hypothetical protein